MATISIFAALYVASSVFAPIAAALFIIAVVAPMQSRLQTRLPKLLALAIVIVVTFVAFVAFASLVAWSFGRVARWLASDAARFQLLYDQATSWLESHGIGVAVLWGEHFNMSWLLRVAHEVAGRVNATLGFWLVVFVYVILGLLETDEVGQRIAALDNQAARRVLIKGSIETAAKFRRFLLIRTLMSAVTGLLVWALTSVVGMPLAVEWGAIAFALNYIPFIGPFVVTTLPTMFALAQFASWQAALAIFMGLNVIQFVLGSYIEPRVSGYTLAISPFMVLFAVFLWTFLWGLFGAFIGVPITIAVLTFCAQHPSSRGLAELFGVVRETPPSTHPC